MADLLTSLEDLPTVAERATVPGSAITLQLPDPDSIRCLRRALENGALSFTHMEVQQATLAELCTRSGRKNEAARHTRRASEYARRAALTQQLVDQLPANTPPMFAPTGER